MTLIQMSDTDDPIDTRAFIADIDRRRAEMHKLVAKAAKTDRWLLPLTWLVVVAGSMIIGVLISLPEYLRMFGWAK